MQDEISFDRVMSFLCCFFQISNGDSRAVVPSARGGGRTEFRVDETRLEMRAQLSKLCIVARMRLRVWNPQFDGPLTRKPGRADCAEDQVILSEL
jgi:hypothetical protein